MQAGLGSFRFSIKTASYDKFNRTTKYRWAGQNRFGARIAKQFVGKGDDKISLSGTIYPDNLGGIYQIEKMRKLAGLGVGLVLFFSYEKLALAKGRWCIESIREEQSFFYANGKPRKQEFTIELSSYG